MPPAQLSRSISESSEKRRTSERPALPERGHRGNQPGFPHVAVCRNRNDHHESETGEESPAGHDVKRSKRDHLSEQSRNAKQKYGEMDLQQRARALVHRLQSLRSESHSGFPCQLRTVFPDFMDCIDDIIHVVPAGQKHTLAERHDRLTNKLVAR